MIRSASARRAAATSSPGISSPASSSSASIRSRAAAIAAEPGRVRRRALAAPRIVARRANARDPAAFAATIASVTAATCACTAEPTSAPSLIAPTVSAAPRSSRSTSTSGRRRWSTIRHTSPSQRNGARQPAVEASSSTPAVVARGAARRARRGRLRRRGRRRAAEQLARRLGGALLEGLRGAHHRPHGRDDLAGELPEEAPTVGIRGLDGFAHVRSGTPGTRAAAPHRLSR